MAYPYVTLNAVSGTGTGNSWTAGGINVGADQSGDGGTESSAYFDGSTKKILSVPLANETDTFVRSNVIEKVVLYVRVKGPSGGSLALGLYVGSFRPGSAQSIGTTYIGKSETYTVNPQTTTAWTWAQIDALMAGCTHTNGAATGTYYADSTYIRVYYKAATGTSTLTLPKLTSSSTGTRVPGKTGTSTLQLPLVDLASSGYRLRSGTAPLTLPKLTLASTGTKSAGIGRASLTLPTLSIASEGYLIHSGYCGAQTVDVLYHPAKDNALRSSFNDNNYGSEKLSVRNYNGYKWNSILTFFIVKWQKALSVSLNLNIINASVSNSHIKISRLLKDWDEGDGTLSVPNTTNYSTWKYRDTERTTQWTTPGALSDGSDYSGIEATILGITNIGWYSVDGLEDLWNRWTLTSASTNFGILLHADADSWCSIDSRESGLATATRPYLNVTVPTFQLPQISVNAVGRVAHLIGTATTTLPLITTSVLGNKLNEGTSELELPICTIESEGYLEGGKVFLDLPMPRLVASGYKVDIIGTSELTIPILTMVSTGNKLRSGTVEVNLPGLMTVEATGVLKHSGTSELTLPILTIVSEGFKATTGTSDLTLPDITLASEGYLTHLGTVALRLPILTIASEGIKSKTGTSSFGVPVVYLQATGVKFKAFTGTIALTLPSLVLVAEGLKLVAGTVDLTLPVPSIASVGNKLNIGTVAISLPVLSISALTYDASLIINTRSGSPLLPGADEWIPSTGSNLGDDQNSLDNIASHGTPGYGGRDLSLQFETPSILNEAYLIKRVTISTYIKVTDSKRTEVRAFIANSDLDVHYKIIGETTSDSYQKFTASWDKNPHDDSDWTWDSVKDICYLGYPYDSWCGIQTVTLPGNEAANVYADYTYIEVFYEKKLTGTVDINLPSLSVQSTGKNYGHGVCHITLPMLTLYGSARKDGTASATLPVPVVSVVGKNYGHGTTSITLPSLQVNANAVYVRSGTSDLTLPIPTLQAVGYKYNEGTATTTLPVLTLSSNGIDAKQAVGVFDLPMPRVQAVGTKMEIGTATISLPSLSVVAEGYCIHLGYSEFTLPKLQVNTKGFFFPSGVETYLWGQFKTQMATNAALNNYISLWSFSRKVRILSRNDYPYIQMFVEGNQNEKYQTMNTKTTDLVVKIICKTQNEDTQTLRNELFILDELIKQTIEKDIQCSDRAIIMKLLTTDFKYLADSIGEIQIKVALTTRRFDEGDRTSTAKRKYGQVEVGLPIGMALQAIGRVN